MRRLLFFVLIAGIAAGFNFNMSAIACENLPVEIRFNQTNSSICEYYLGSPAGGSFYLGYDYKCGNLTVPWQNITAMERDWEGAWNATVVYGGNRSSAAFSIAKALGMGNISFQNRSEAVPAFLPGEDIWVVANWTENCNDGRLHRFSISAGGSETEVYYGPIGVKNVSYAKLVSAPSVGGTYAIQLMHAQGGPVESIGSREVAISTSSIDFSGIELSGVDTVRIGFANAAGQGIVRDINIRLRGGFKEASKSIVTPYGIPKSGGSVVTSIPGGFQAIGLMAGAAYTAELHAVVDEPERDYVIERNFSGTFGGFCGDEVCMGECSSCPMDCSLAECGNDGACSRALGENCENSPSDCKCAEKEECFSGACIPIREKPFMVSVVSVGAPVANALVESQSGSCITDASGACSVYAGRLDVLKVTKSGYVEQTGLAADGVTINMAKEESKILDASGTGVPVQESGIGFAGIAKKAAPVALAFLLVAAIINILLKKRKPASQGPGNAVPG